MDFDQLTQQRIDFARLPDGSVEATLTVTLPEGKVFRFKGAAADEIGAELTPLEKHDWSLWQKYQAAARNVRGNRIGAGGSLAPRVTYADAVKIEALRKKLRSELLSKWRLRPDPRVPMRNDKNGYAYWGPSYLKNREELYTPGAVPLKEIGKALKKVATIKTLAIAAGSLLTAVPILGPVVGPAALAAATAIGVTEKLFKAGDAAAKGAKDIAKVLTSDAVKDAARLTKTPAAAKDLLHIANTKRKNLEKLIDGAASAAQKAAKAAAAKPPTARPAAPKPAPKKHSDVLAAARAGRLRSNQGGNISQAALVAAANNGRVFWVSP